MDLGFKSEEFMGLVLMGLEFIGLRILGLPVAWEKDFWVSCLGFKIFGLRV